MTTSASRLAALAILSGGLPLLAPAPAFAQVAVYDAGNHAQNLLTAARALAQIDNQLRQLQNQATSLANEARNLATIDFAELGEIRRTLSSIDALMARAEGIGFAVRDVEREADALFPRGIGGALGADARVAAARARLDSVMAAHRRTLAMQAQIAENVTADARALAAIAAKSQDAQGALQVGQATNQLLALGTKQQLQLQSLLAAQQRAQTIEQARRAQAEAEARAATARFLGSGRAYTPR